MGITSKLRDLLRAKIAADKKFSNIQAPDNAIRYLNENTDISQTAKYGFGTQFVNNMVRQRISSMNIGSMVNDVYSNAYNNGMEFSGVGDKLVGQIMAGAVGTASSAETEANSENQNAAVGAQGTMMRIMAGKDSLDLQAEGMRQNWYINALNREAMEKAKGGGILGTGLKIAQLGMGIAAL